ncbi:anti-sigma factor family protein [Microbacterium amylolyticum]|uniref:Anti-sigma factor (TIGR02949 family) n=1 Tax=Microbacterium amylolyticum TaxID=936337 RepID=A0ABS4ZKC9_9MICO|nr:zf-HC2 domain-containing protein [Microbacterium amylolyticum]MBP2436906.1 anti-sigma factor (TIGR02949 family) [Microbacterium amylolyticum]
MSDCGCEKTRADLEAFVRGEIACCQTAYAEIREHIETCPSCQDEATVARTLTVAVQRACQEETVPADLKSQVIAKLRDLQREHE